MRRFLPLFLLCALCAAPRAWGSAFAINELGVRAQGMAGAFASIADDGSAIFYNPAGMAFQTNTTMEMDTLVVVGLFRFFPSESPPGVVTPPNGWSGSIKPHFIPVANLYFLKPINEKFTFGFGGFAPFGLSDNFTNFKDGDPQNTKFPGRYAGSRAALQQFWFQPTLSYRISENSSIAGGVALVHTHLFLEESILNPNTDGDTFGLAFASTIFPGTNPAEAAASIARLLPEGRFRAAATSNAAGFNLGYMYKIPSKKISIGLAWRSAVVNHLSGKAAFAFTNTGAITPFLPAGTTFASLFPNQPIKGDFTTPGTYTAGISSRYFHNTLIAVDFEVQDFRRFKDLPVDFSDTAGTALPAVETLNFDFHNSYITHVGAERQVGQNMAVRMGYSYDVSPVPDQSVGPLFPDSNRNSITFGGTYRHGAAELSIFYQAMFFLERNVNVAANAGQYTNGSYRNFADLAGLGMRLYPGELFGKGKVSRVTQ
jgi:long-chain fatty acid transport protein